jgi:hypothetical protein
MKFKILKMIIATFAFSFSAYCNASLITSMSNGTPVNFTHHYDYIRTPIVENGYTFTSSHGAHYGLVDFGFGANGMWNDLSIVAISSGRSGRSIKFEFHNPVSSILGFFNYPPSYGQPSISIFDTAGILLESYMLDFSFPSSPFPINQGEYYGFARQTNEIGSFVISGKFVGMTDMEIARVEVTEPSTLVLLLLTFFFLFVYRFYGLNWHYKTLK